MQVGLAEGRLDGAAKPQSFLISVLFHPGSRHIDVCSYFRAHATAGGRGVITEKLYISGLFFQLLLLHQED